jgi:hypothetical protein
VKTTIRATRTKTGMRTTGLEAARGEVEAGTMMVAAVGGVTMMMMAMTTTESRPP